MTDQEMTCFWGSPFSNWHLCPVAVRGHEFNCVEQYYMAAKAWMFGSPKIAQKIVESDSPREQKKLGRTIDNFNSTMWDAISRDVMFRGVMCKFSQNDHLKTLLLETGNSIIVEASPYDTIWGVGLAADDPLIRNPENWRGNNWLGQILMEVRGILK